MRGFEKLRFPKVFNLRSDPFERGDTSMLYDQWLVHHAPMTYGAVALTTLWLQSFKDFPPRQRPASFNLDEVMHKLQEGSKGSN